MKRSIKLISLLAIVAAMTLTSCSKYPGYTKGKDGLYYKFYFKSSDTSKVFPGKVLTMNLRYYFKYKGKDSVLMDNVKQGFKFMLPYQLPMYKGDIYTAFGMLHKGDSASFVLNAKNFFLKTAQQPLPPFIDSTTVLYFDVKLLNAQTQLEMDKERVKRQEDLQKQEPINIKNYLAKNNINVQPTDSGIYYIEQVKGKGKMVAKDDMVKYQMVISQITDKGVSELFSSLKQGNGTPLTAQYGQSNDTKALKFGLGMMTVGTKARIISPSRLAFGPMGYVDQRSGKEIVAPFAPIIYDIEMLSAQTKEQFDQEQKVKQEQMGLEAAKNKADEPRLIADYVKAHNITAKPTYSGLYFISTEHGKGIRAVKGNSVTVNYTGKLLNGSVFDSSKGRAPFKFVLGYGQVIPGWDEAISYMYEGGKATIIVPSKLAYGERSMDKIPGNSPLVFDVELVKIDSPNQKKK